MRDEGRQNADGRRKSGEGKKRERNKVTSCPLSLALL
jgi:hypothetical protein